MSIWLEKELELNRKYDELLQRREALLRGTERYFDSQMRKSFSFVSSYEKARERNNQICARIEELSQDTFEINLEDTPKFKTVRKNYLAMMRKTYQLWCDESYDKSYRRGSHTPSPPPGRRSGGSPRRLTPRSRTPSPSQKRL
ncbi:DgyrCDS418 [Dimorphilus gyrociliatus]|uniref:DgyrCDS418 n=1 Tax=Dimorphilus gyrociliatus TaxID=2664684 RepID=A0A7I8V716_9ANNE|nr:DgyrCDS418 [Dimorphilus gyrociliatus]